MTAHQNRQAAIEALLAKWQTRQYGQHAGYLSAADTVDVVLAALYPQEGEQAVREKAKIVKYGADGYITDEMTVDQRRARDQRQRSTINSLTGLLFEAERIIALRKNVGNSEYDQQAEQLLVGILKQLEQHGYLFSQTAVDSIDVEAVKLWCAQNAHMLECLSTIDIVLAWEEHCKDRLKG